MKAFSRLVLVLLLALGAVLGCSGSERETFTGEGISFDYPRGWHVTGFSGSTWPPRLAVTSYAVPEDAVEGDCGGLEAVSLLPPEGALVLLIDYGGRGAFRPRPATLTMSAGDFADYECFGPSTMFRFRVGSRDFQAHVALGPGTDEETRQRALAILDGLTLTDNARASDPIDFVPATRREGDSMVLPLTFPDGTRAELVYPPALDVAALGVFPYSSGRLYGKSATPGRADVVARDFWIRYGDLDEILVLRDFGSRRPPGLLARYKGVDGRAVGLWDLHSDDTAHELGLQFGQWAVLVYDYVGAGAMTDAEHAAWAAHFSGRETDGGFLVLEASGPLRLAAAGEHAGPQLTFSAADPRRELTLYPGACTPHSDQNRLVHRKRVQWGGGFADWCLSGEMRVHAGGSRDFVGALIRHLAVRNVVLAGG